MKITDIVIEVNGTKEVRDANGKLVREKVKKKVKRKVNVVTGGKRFGHYLVDIVCIIVLGIIYGVLFETEAPEQTFYIESSNHSVGVGASSNSYFDPVGYIVAFLFYFVFELALARTPGKYVTKSIVINEYGLKPNAKEIFIRSISRLVPFEALSCLSERGWHDKWSKTFVVTLDEQKKLSELLGNPDLETDILDDTL